MNTAPNTALQVITHNGQPPSQGGKRLGYRGFDPDLGWVQFGLDGSGPTLAELTQAKGNSSNGQSPAQAVVTPTAARMICYDSLLLVTNDNDCPHCYNPIRREHGSFKETDIGTVRLYTCGSCRNLLRVY